MLHFPVYAEPYTYAPEACEFSVTFPQEPIIKRTCENPETQERCYDLVTYTQTYGLEATVDFRIICNPIDEAIKKNYSNAIIAATLKEMTKDKVEKEFEVNVHEADGYKLAGIVGEGKKGLLPSMYLAQLWIGDASALSIESELVGEEHKEADTLLQSVLRSIHHKASHTNNTEVKKTPSE